MNLKSMVDTLTAQNPVFRRGSKVPLSEPPVSDTRMEDLIFPSF
jgi:hypothetical protein